MLWTELGNLDAEVSTNYKLVFSSEVPPDFIGELLEISLFSSRPDTTEWKLKVTEEVQFKDKKIYSSLTLPYGNKRVYTGHKVILWAKTDGTATNIAASLTGELIYLGKRN